MSVIRCVSERNGFTRVSFTIASRSLSSGRGCRKFGKSRGKFERLKRRLLQWERDSRFRSTHRSEAKVRGVIVADRRAALKRMRLDADDAFIAATTNKRVKTNSCIRFLRYRGQLNFHVTATFANARCLHSTRVNLYFLR